MVPQASQTSFNVANSSSEGMKVRHIKIQFNGLPQAEIWGQKSQINRYMNLFNSNETK